MTSSSAPRFAFYALQNRRHDAATAGFVSIHRVTRSGALGKAQYALVPASKAEARIQGLRELNPGEDFRAAE